jgi:hypothetical protein
MEVLGFKIPEPPTGNELVKLKEYYASHSD